MRGPCEYEVGPAEPLKHTCQLGEVASSETCNDREIYPFLPVEVHTRDGALRKALYQNIFMISDEKNFWLIEVFLFGFDTDFTHELSKSLFFCNRRNSFLSFGGPQLRRLCHSPMISMIVIELADKLYKSVTVCSCSSS